MKNVSVTPSSGENESSSIEVELLKGLHNIRFLNPFSEPITC